MISSFFLRVCILVFTCCFLILLSVFGSYSHEFHSFGWQFASTPIGLMVLSSTSAPIYASWFEYLLKVDPLKANFGIEQLLLSIYYFLVLYFIIKIYLKRKGEKC